MCDVVRIRDAEALERAEVVGVTELGAEPLELVPVPLLPVGAELLGQVAAQVVRHGVVVEQRVVDVEEVDGGVGRHEASIPMPPAIDSNNRGLRV